MLEQETQSQEFRDENGETLSDALARHRLSLSKSKARLLGEYCRLLWDWNTRLNLTRHTTFEKFVVRDLVDSLALDSFLHKGERVLDVGTGGGVPGIPLAILRPDLKIELCDSTGKKTLAVSEMVSELKLDIPVWHAKVEEVLAKREKGNRFSTLTIRAVAKLADLLRMVQSHWTTFDRLLLVKGPRWVDERGESRHYNLLNKLALRCLKKYSSTREVQQDDEHYESVILQICRKESFETLDGLIAKRIAEKSEEAKQSKRHQSRHRKIS